MWTNNGVPFGGMVALDEEMLKNNVPLSRIHRVRCSPSSRRKMTCNLPRVRQRTAIFSWHELTTSDHVAAFDFYSKLFGWEKNGEHDMGPMGMYLMYGQGETMYGGMFTATLDMPPPNWLCYIKVPDATDAAKTIARLGGTVMRETMEVPSGDWIAIASDPQGAMTAVQSGKTK